jgi:hypothetical protein
LARKAASFSGSFMTISSECWRRSRSFAVRSVDGHFK